MQPKPSQTSELKDLSEEEFNSLTKQQRTRILGEVFKFKAHHLISKIALGTSTLMPSEIQTL